MASDHFRSHARRAVSLAARLVVAADGSERDVRVVDLGLGGAGVELADDLGVGTTVTLHFVAPNLWDALVLAAQLRWSAVAEGPGFRAGLAFEHHSTRGLRSLVELLGAEGFE